MIAIDLKTLINKLDSNCRKALEAAIGTAVTRTNYNVEKEHWLLNLLDANLIKLLEEQEVDVDAFRQDLQNNIERFKIGNSSTPGLAPSLVELIRNSWMLASLTFKATAVNSAHILYTILNEEDTLGQRQKISAELNKIDLTKLREQIQQLSVGESKEGEQPAAKNFISSEDAQEALNKFTVDITEQARQGKIDPIMGRDNEIRQMIDILTRRRQNNPILTGEAGVGKTAIVEGLAQRIIKNDVPPALQNVSLRYLDLAAIQAGAGVKGEFEKRLKNVIDAVQNSPTPIIMFIDEAHNLMGAGGQAGSGDAANLLKPALARGELRTIAATTWAEYKKYIENDAALTRRFQVVKVDEPIESVAIDMMRGLVSSLEKHHNVRILDEAVVASVKLSSRYIPSRHLPDKSVSLLDTACARIRLSQTATPPVVEDCEHRIEQTKLSIKFLEREELTGANHKEQLAALNKLLKDDQKQIEILKKNWQHEVELVKQIGQLRKDIESHAVDAKAKTKLISFQKTLKEVTQKLKNAQGETPLIYDCVDAQIVAAVVSDWTGIPLGRMVRDEVATTLSLQAQLEQRILGQTSAMHTLAQQLQIARAGLHDPNKPRGVFLLVGSSGVGKTETALALADSLYGGEQNMTVINMSEFKEPHKISMLTGSPAGYVGYGEGGILTEAVRRKPYSVVLLDEMEKAHPSVQEVFYQVCDKGILMDGEGRRVDFKNTLVLMACNVGSDTMLRLFEKYGAEMASKADIKAELEPDLLKFFKPAFLGRVTVVPYFPLSDEILAGITMQKLDHIKHRMLLNYKAELQYSKAVINEIVKRCQTVNTGARNIDNIINNSLLPNIATHFLQALADGRSIKTLKLSVDKKSAFQYQET